MHHGVERRIGIEAPLRGQGTVERLGQVFDRDLVVQRDVGADAHIRVVEAEPSAQNLAPGSPGGALVRITMDENHRVGFLWHGCLRLSRARKVNGRTQRWQTSKGPAESARLRLPVFGPLRAGLSRPLQVWRGWLAF